ncbi:MAG: hypothetical protein ACRDPD_05195 [Streptosporangiaceae bacterium]
MDLSLLQSTVSLPASPFPPLAVGFMGLGTGYLIYGPQELFGYPKRDERVDFATGMWGIWMPGFMQFIAGAYLFLGLTLFGTFTAPPLYMAALAFTAYGVHWFAIGWNRLRQADPRANVGMTVAFTFISILGIIVFFKAGDEGVGILFCGLTAIYVSDFFASIKADIGRPGNLGEQALGTFHIATGFWLFYLMFADILNAILKFTLFI